MAEYLMALGKFQFSVDTASFDEYEHSASYKWAAQERIGKRPLLQYLGIEGEEFSLSGVIYPAFKGQVISLSTLREMANKGKAYTLILGTGDVLGSFVIMDIQDKRSVLFADGVAQKIEFSLKLKRYDNDNNLLGTINDALYN